MMITSISDSKIRLAVLLLFLLSCHPVWAGIEIIGMRFFERREVEPPYFRAGRLYNLEKIHEYLEADNISCSGGEAEHSYELVIYAINAGNEYLDKVQVKLTETLKGDAEQFPGNSRVLEIGKMKPGEAKVVKAPWPDDSLNIFDRVLERNFKALSMRFVAGNGASHSSIELPLILCE